MFGADYDDICRPLVMKIVGVDPRCRRCGSGMSEKVSASFLAGKRVQCRCGWYGTWRSGTVLEASRLSNVQFLALFFRYTVPADAPAIAKHLSLDPGTVREWRDKILSAVRGVA